MSVFVIFSKEKKVIAEEKFFNNYIEANKYTKENYSDDFIAKVTDFRFNDDFKSMCKDVSLCKTKAFTNRFGIVNGFLDEEGNLFVNGSTTMGDFDAMNKGGIKYTYLSKIEFIKKYNSFCK